MCSWSLVDIDVFDLERDQKGCGSVVDLMLRRHGYRKATFVRDWSLVDIDAFDLQRDQLSLPPNVMDPSYVSNLVFWP